MSEAELLRVITGPTVIKFFDSFSENNHIYISYDSENTDKSELVRYRSFTRYWKLPSDADTASVRAEYKQGILSVFVPRETPANNSIDIDIKWFENYL